MRISNTTPLALLALMLVACGGSPEDRQPTTTAINADGSVDASAGAPQDPEVSEAQLLQQVTFPGGTAPLRPARPKPPFGLSRDDEFGLQQRAPLDGLLFPTDPAQPQLLGIKRVFTGLTFAQPVQLMPAPDTAGDLYVVEQDGRIRVFDNDVQVTTSTTFLDIRSKVNREGGEEGLLNLVFDPDFGTTNGTYWVHYSAANPRRSVIARFEATFPQTGHPVTDPATETVILEIPQPFTNHNGGGLMFGPDDMLYVGIGDGGAADDPFNNSQNLSTLLGTVLRLDVRGQTTYTVPKDNPFVGVNGALPEIWAYGLRNPWRMSFDRETGELWVGDVGQNRREEVSIIKRGGNYGWPIFEGNLSYLNPNGLPASSFEAPVIDYDHQTGTCVIGGLVVRGNRLPSVSGAYLYCDFSQSQVWALIYDGSKVVSNTSIQTVSRPVSMAEDDAGEVYIIEETGEIWRLDDVTNPPSSTLPDHLSETGLFVDTARMIPNPGLIEFDVKTPLWTDRAGKKRWLGLPTGTHITVAGDGSWSFPLGTVLVKHFEMNLNPQGAPAIRRLETRVILRADSGWRAFTYRWNDAGTDADLLLDRFSETLDISDPSAPGGIRQQRYDYPSRNDCRRCHDKAAGFVLGVSARQLNREFDFAEARDNQLRTWNHIGLFDRDLGAAVDIPVTGDPQAPADTVDLRARLYLDANCSFCHRPGGPAPGSMDMRFQTPQAQMSLLDVRPSEGDLGIADPWRVRPGSPAQSVLWQRIQRLDAFRMPPLGSHVVDEEGVELLRLWIQSL